MLCNQCRSKPGWQIFEALPRVLILTYDRVWYLYFPPNFMTAETGPRRHMPVQVKDAAYGAPARSYSN